MVHHCSCGHRVCAFCRPQPVVGRGLAWAQHYVLCRRFSESWVGYMRLRLSHHRLRPSRHGQPAVPTHVVPEDLAGWRGQKIESWPEVESLDYRVRDSKETFHSLVDLLVLRLASVLRMACESSRTRWFPDAEVTRRTRSWQSTVWLHRRCQGHQCRLLRHRTGEVLAEWSQFPWQSMHFYHRRRPLSRIQHTRTSSCRREKRQSLRHCREGRDRSTHGAVGALSNIGNITREAW